ncbi:MAG TPA: DUF6049 family protein [Beutenbergiaceae bacterium]|nr:DUF6049 family protein [Beutenbergiaceae bacterium]
MNLGSRRWSHWLCAAALSGVLLLTLSIAIPAQAEPQEDDPDGLSVELTQINPSVLRPGEDLTIRGTITNDTTEPVQDPMVRMQMQAHVPDTSEALAGWLDGTISANIVALTAQELDTEIEPGSSASFTVSIPDDDSPFLGVPAWGPRGFEVSVSTPELSATTRNVLLWFPDQSPLPAPSELTVLAPFTPTAAEWHEAIDSEVPVGEVAAERFGDLMEATEADAVTWALDPAVLEEHAPVPTSIQDMVPATDIPGTAQDDAATDEPGADDTGEIEDPDGAAETGSEQPAAGDIEELLEDFAAGARGRDIIQLDYADTDLSALAHAQDLTMLRVGSERGQTLLTDAGISVLDDVRWPAGRIDGQSLSALAGEDTQAVVLSETTLPADPALSTSAPARTEVDTDSGALDTVVWDADLSELLAGQSADSEDRESLLTRQLVLAETALLVRDGGEEARGLLAALPRDATAAGLAGHLDQLAQAPWLELTNLRGLLGRADSGDVRIPPPQTLTDSRRLSPEALNDMEADHETISTFAGIVSEPDVLLDGFQPALLTSLGHAWVTDPAGREELANASAGNVEELADSIQVELGSTPNLIARTGELPITVESALPMPAEVVVSLEPHDPRLRAPEEVEAALEPQTLTTVQVPIQGVANGNVDVTAEVRDTAGARVSEGAQFAVRVRADWEDIGTVIVVSLLAVAFVVGLARTIRSGRRGNKGAGQPVGGEQR